MRIGRSRRSATGLRLNYTEQHPDIVAIEASSPAEGAEEGGPKPEVSGAMQVRDPSASS